MLIKTEQFMPEKSTYLNGKVEKSNVGDFLFFSKKSPFKHILKNQFLWNMQVKKIQVISSSPTQAIPPETPSHYPHHTKPQHILHKRFEVDNHYRYTQQYYSEKL